jgi:hypothetical protein
MSKPILQLAAVGIVGVAVWKLASLFLLPVLFFVLKIALIAGVAMFAFWWINKQSKKDTPPPPPPPPTAESP